MFKLIIKNLLRRPLRTGLTVAGIALAAAVLVCVAGFGEGYRRGLTRELERSGVQMMLVPLGCPYDAASRVLKNHTLETSLPAAALEAVRRDPDVAIAAPLLMAAVPRQNDRRTDLWVGLDETAVGLKPWWQMRAGRSWFGASNEVILGADSAALEIRSPGDKLFSPELDAEFLVAGVLERSGTSDDSVFFVSVATAQRMFGQTNRLTAVAIRLKDPAHMRQVSERLQRIPGAQVVTLTEMMGTFLNLLGAVRTLITAVAAIGIAVSALSVLNTLLASVIERSQELAIIRAIGGSRTQTFILLAGEGLILSAVGATLGAVLAMALGPEIETIAKRWVSFASNAPLFAATPEIFLRTLALLLTTGIVAAIYPAWRAAMTQPAIATRSV